MKLHPFVLAPRFVSKIWGGRRLNSVLGKSLPVEGPIGESWEVYDFPPGSVGVDARQPGDDPNGWTSSRIVNGRWTDRSIHDVMRTHRTELLGDAPPVRTAFGEQFPLLVKFLDAREDLSVQVHPPERYVGTHPDSFLKNECWTVLASEPGARLLIGTKPGVTREQFAAALREGTCESLLNSIPARVGETHYLPSGTVHALGGGVLVAEVQTPSDTTFRVFDFGRLDPTTGAPRALHVESGLECIDFANDWRDGFSEAGEDDRVIARAPQFTVSRRVRVVGASAMSERLESSAGRRVSLDQGAAFTGAQRDVRDEPCDGRGAQRYEPGEMRVLIGIDGAATLQHDDGTIALSRGQVVLLPASVGAVVRPVDRAVWLEATVNR